jgi:hypothetical protein
MPDDFDFHAEPRTGGPRGLRRVIVPFRRLLVRILRPIFLRLQTFLSDVDTRQNRLDLRQEWMGRQVDALLNHGWDQAALLRRIATLEQQVEELLQRTVSPEPVEAAAPVSYFTEVDGPVSERPSAPR